MRPRYFSLIILLLFSAGASASYTFSDGLGVSHGQDAYGACNDTATKFYLFGGVSGGNIELTDLTYPGQGSLGSATNCSYHKRIMHNSTCDTHSPPNCVTVGTDTAYQYINITRSGTSACTISNGTKQAFSHLHGDAFVAGHVCFNECNYTLPDTGVADLGDPLNTTNSDGTHNNGNMMAQGTSNGTSCSTGDYDEKALVSLTTAGTNTAGDSLNCITTQDGSQVCYNKAKTGCGTVNGNDVCVATLPKGTCTVVGVSGDAASYACDTGVKPAVPAGGTAGTAVGEIEAPGNIGSTTAAGGSTGGQVDVVVSHGGVVTGAAGGTTTGGTSGSNGGAPSGSGDALTLPTDYQRDATGAATNTKLDTLHSDITTAPTLPTDNPAIPTMATPTEFTGWTSGLGDNASCPADQTVTVLGHSVTLSWWSKACTVASDFRPFVLGLAGLIAAGIVGGVRIAQGGGD